MQEINVNVIDIGLREVTTLQGEAEQVSPIQALLDFRYDVVEAFSCEIVDVHDLYGVEVIVLTRLKLLLYLLDPLIPVICLESAARNLQVLRVELAELCGKVLVSPSKLILIRVFIIALVILFLLYLYLVSTSFLLLLLLVVVE